MRPLIECDAGCLEAEALGERLAADGDEDDVGFERAGGAAFGRLDRTCDRAVFRHGDFVAELELHALLLQRALEGG